MSVIVRAVLACVVATLVVCGPRVATAGSPEGAWIVGTWEGRHQAPTIPEDATRFEFIAEGEVIRWTMTRKGQIRLRQSTAGGSVLQNGEWRASGTVTKIAEGAVELEGKYDASSFAAVVGRAVGYTLRGSPDALDGHLVGAQNVHFPITLRRVR